MMRQSTINFVKVFPTANALKLKNNSLEQEHPPTPKGVGRKNFQGGNGKKTEK